MGVDGLEQMRPWPLVVAMNLVVVFFVALTNEPLGHSGQTTRGEAILDRLREHCSQHICCRYALRVRGGCSTTCWTPGGHVLPAAADGWSGGLEEQAIEIFDVYPDRFSACEIVDSLEPRSPELETICHPTVVTEPPEPATREDLLERIREKDDQISVLLDSLRGP